MDLFENLIAHDCHPCEGCKEEKLVEVSQYGTADLGKVTAMVLVDDENKKSK